MSILEIVGTAFASVYIALAIKERQLSWMAAIVSSALYCLLFWQNRFYLQALLQIFFIASSLYGWWNWRPEKAKQVGNLSAKQFAALLFGTGCLSATLTQILVSCSDSPAPGLDSLTTSLSIAASVLMAHKKIEAWKLWILVNLVSIYLFFSQGLLLTSVVYLGFLLLSGIGFKAWKAQMRTSALVA